MFLWRAQTYFELRNQHIQGLENIGSATGASPSP